MDLNGVEADQLQRPRRRRHITVNDLTGTDVTEVNLDLAGTPGSGIGDGPADTVIVNGTNGDDVITVAGDAGGVTVLGPGRPGEHHRRRGRQRPADRQRPGRRRRGRGVRAWRPGDPAHRRTAATATTS